MIYAAQVRNSPEKHEVTLKVGNREQAILISAKPTGGSSVTGGELLFLALATCYCNDIYREAAKWSMTVKRVDVEVEGDFEGPGKPASNIIYRVHVDADADEEKLKELILHTDRVAEIHNTLRIGMPVRLEL